MTAEAVELHRYDNHRIAVSTAADGDRYYSLERWVLCGCPHCAGHWNFIAGSSTPPHDLLLRDAAAGVDWQWMGRESLTDHSERNASRDEAAQSPPTAEAIR